MKRINYIYLDLDGTIAHSDYNISIANINAISYLKSIGIKVGIATGRSLHTLKKELDLIKPNLPTIALNGGVIYNGTNSIFEDKTLGLAGMNAIELLKKFNIHYTVYTRVGIYCDSYDSPNYIRLKNIISEYEDKYKKFAFEVVMDHEEMKTKRINKIVVIFNDEKEKEFLFNILSELKDVEICCSSSTQIDILPANVSKGNAIKLMQTVCGFELDELMVFGDNDNDVSMFQLVDNSVVLKNGTYLAKSYAKYITQLTCDENGFADFIEKFFLNKND